jgi:FlaA1/EpsC-like NDP-sugar epimerase
MKVREWFSLQYFRVQQIQALVSSLLAIMSFAVVIALYFGWQDTTRLLILVLVVIVGIYTFAWIWDMFLKVWIARQVINVRRNPFSIWRMTPREQVQYKETIIPIMKSQRATILMLNKFAKEMELNPIATVDPDDIGLSEDQIQKWERISGEGRFVKEDYPPELRDIMWDEDVSLEKIRNGNHKHH